jgi:hypothetical protein
MIFGPSPVAACTTANAICVKSLRLLARVGMMGRCHYSGRVSNRRGFKLHQYRKMGNRDCASKSIMRRSGLLSRERRYRFLNFWAIADCRRRPGGGEEKYGGAGNENQG